MDAPDTEYGKRIEAAALRSRAAYLIQRAEALERQADEQVEEARAKYLKEG